MRVTSDMAPIVVGPKPVCNGPKFGKELARHTDGKMTMKYAHVGIGDRAKALANLPFQECNRSKPVTAEGHPETSAGTSKPANGTAQETTNPGGDRGYVVLCLPETPDGVPEEKWRRRELNPRPAIFPRKLLRA